MDKALLLRSLMVGLSSACGAVMAWRRLNRKEQDE